MNCGETAVVESKDIMPRLSSSDGEVLRLCDEYMDWLLANEKARRERAEDKSQDMLKMCGAGATIIVGLMGFVYGKYPASLNVPVLLLFVAAILLVVKSVYFSLRALEPSKGHGATPDFVFEVQKKSVEETLKDEIAVKIWLYYMDVPRNTLKLFRLHRSIRNFAVFILNLLVISAILLVLVKANGLTPNCLTYSLAATALLISILLDPVAERLSKLWK
jgi:hypothetical protein